MTSSVIHISIVKRHTWTVDCHSWKAKCSEITHTYRMTAVMTDLNFHSVKGYTQSDQTRGWELRMTPIKIKYQ